MARTRKSMFANYEAPSSENKTQQESVGKFLVIKPEYFNMKWDGVKGNGEATIDVLPYQFEIPAGVSVDVDTRAKQKDKVFDNNGCYIDKEPNQDWVFQLNYWVHHNVGPNKASVVCPRTFGKPCPICEQKQNLLSNWPYPKGSDESKEYFKTVVAPLDTKNRTLFNIVAQDEDGNPKWFIWDTSWFFVPKEILSINKHPKTKEPIMWFDPEDGKSIYFEYRNFDKEKTRPEVSGVQFIDRDEKTVDMLFDMIPQAIALETVLIETSYDDLKDMMEGTKHFGEAQDNSRSDEEMEQECEDQLDAAFGSGSDENENDVPFDVDEPEEEEKPSRSRSREKESKDNPKVAKVKAINDLEELDDFCEANDIELFCEDFEDDFDKFKEAVIEYVS